MFYSSKDESEEEVGKLVEVFNLKKKEEGLRIAELNPLSLNVLLVDGRYLEASLYRELRASAEKASHARGINLLPEQACLLIECSCKNKRGFNDEHSLGFSHYTQNSITVRPSVFGKKSTNTVMVLRTLVHDSIHWNTHTRFAYGKRSQKLYKKEYGFNRRDEYGNSYSSPNLSTKDPPLLNLNIWMEGITDALTRSILLEAMNEVGLLKSKPSKRQIEIIDCAYHDPTARGFVAGIMNPVAEFLSYWGEPLAEISARAMLSGKRDELEIFFAEKTGEEHAWQKMFRQKAFIEKT